MVIHAANDPTVGVDSTRDKFERFTALDPYDVRYAEYEGVFGPDGFEYPNGHWSWIMFLATIMLKSMRRHSSIGCCSEQGRCRRVHRDGR